MDNELERRRRTADNQALFRRINDRVEQLNEAFALFEEYGDWACECADLKCFERVEMTLDEYEGVRAHPTRFLVAPGDVHVELDVERVVHRVERYWIVEKVGPAAARAEELDSRA